MATDELLQAEARERPRVAIAAGIAALLTLAGPIIGLVVLKDSPENLPAGALYRHEHQAGLAASAACSVLGLIAIVVLLDFLYRATRARNPALPAQLRPLPWIGGLGLAALSVAIQVLGAIQLADFANHGSQTYDEAKAAADFGGLVYAAIAAQLALAFAFVMISINAMRVGLLTRFLGYLGVISAVLFILPLVPLPIVQAYWLGALAALLAGRSPTGTPAAWSSGRAEPWPSAQEMREQRVREAEARRGDTVEEPAEVAEPVAGPSPATSQRKRKKRR